MEKINIGLIGFGNIGTGVVKILKKNSRLIEKRTGLKFNLKSVCVKNLNKKRDIELPPETKLTANVDDILSDKEINIVVELIGGLEPARTIILKTLASKKNVVTANKALISAYGKEIINCARENNVNIAFEAAVCGCIPILRALQDSLAADNILSIYGLINGTTNYILTKMSLENRDYNSALKEAQKLGFAEPDPSFDVLGKDAAQKLSILACLAYNMDISENDIYTEGITDISKRDIEYAERLGYRIKLLAIAKKVEGIDKKIELRVTPTMIPKTHLLASVLNELNAVYVLGDNVQQQMYYGRGAGQLPTASTVISDVINLAHRVRNNYSLPSITYFNEKSIEAIDNISTRYYLRLSVIDKPAVLARITGILGSNNISIAGFSQEERSTAGPVPIILTTHYVKEKNIREAVEEIDRLDVVKEKCVVIRIEEFK